MPVLSETLKPDVKQIHEIEIRLDVNVCVAAGLLGLDSDKIKATDKAVLLARVDLVGDRFARVAVELDLEGKRSEIMKIERASCKINRIDAMLHLDIRDAETRLLSLSLDSMHQVCYVRSDIPARLNLPGGTYNPPRVEFIKRAANVDVA